ncbi:MAG: 1-hydroxycarotenoid 3,4-desaturase CrtD [Bacteroidota bacterium]
MSHNAVIIGAGVGGLASAIHLSRMGFAVDVFESASVPGGKLNEVRGNGFRFDAGPSLFTLPEMALELLDPDLQFEVTRLPLITRYFWKDGMILDAHSDADMLCAEAERVTGVPADRLRNYLEETAEIYRLTAPVFIFNSLHKPENLLSRKGMTALLGLHRLKAFTSLHDYNRKKIGHDRLVQMLDRYATYNGSDPYQTPATLRVIAHLEHNLGAWLPDGGMYTIVRALMKQAERLHVRFHFNNPVREVVTEGNRISGVRTSDGFFPAGRVVSNVDVRYFYSKLLPDTKKLRKLSKQQMSSSALIFYWGIKGNFPGLDVHNIFFGDRYREEFTDLFRNFRIGSDPTVYVYISSKIFSGDAPEHCENWFVMVNAPENVGQDWPETVKSVRKSVLQKLEKVLCVKLEDKIMFEEVLDPVSIERKTGSWHGSLYGPSSNSQMSAFQRHANFSSGIRGLYFTGGSVHPGGGIPLCLSSAKITASIIKREI